ncbi:MAG: leucine-rich repeat protein [Clostridia bacterium]|nr:leucine-rich repeat protein [Clostridia bacterium]
MKRALSILLAFIFIFGIWFSAPVTANAASNPVFTINSDGFKNGEIVFDICLAPNQSIQNGMVSVKYNTTVLEVVEAGEATYIDNDGNICSVVPGMYSHGTPVNDNSCYTFAWMSADEFRVVNSTKIFTIKFRLKAENNPPTNIDFLNGAYNSTDVIKSYISASTFSSPEIVSVDSMVNGVRIEWTPVDGVEGYMVFKKTDKGLTNIAIVNNETTFFTDVNVSDGDRCVYSVSSMDCYGFSSISAEFEFTYVLPKLRYELNSQGNAYYLAYCEKSLTGAVTVPEEYYGLPVTGIADNAFRGCAMVTSVSIPDSIISIGEYAFSDCYSLESVAIPDGVESIGFGAFENCTSLKMVGIGESVTNISSAMFRNCTGITKITIPDNVINVGSYAFENCSALRTVEIGAGVSRIGLDAFSNCSSLAVFTVSYNNEFFSDEDGVLFNKSKTELINYPVKRLGATYTVPDGVLSIGSSAFAENKSLKSVVIPGSISDIYSDAFKNCTSIVKVIFKGSRSQWSNINIESGNNSLTNAEIIYEKFEDLAKPEFSYERVKGGINVTWNGVDGATGYNIYRAENKNGSFMFWEKIASCGINDSEFTDVNVVSGNVYKYAVSAICDGYETDYDSFGMVIYLDEPQILKTESLNEGVYFEWNSVRGAEGYVVYKLADGEFKSIAFCTQDETSFTDAAVTENETCTYAVASMDFYGELSTYTPFEVTYCFDIPSPEHYYSREKDGIRVVWSKTENALGYNLYRSEKIEGEWSEWTKLNSFNENINEYIDKSVASGSSYKYGVSAIYENYASSYEGNGEVIYLAEPVITSCESLKNGIRFTWGMVDGVEGYIVFRKTESGFEKLAVLGSTTNVFIDNTVSDGESYTYAVASMDMYGNYATYTPFDVSFALPEVKVPATPEVNAKCTSEGISVTWNEVEDAESYIVYRRIYNSVARKWSGWYKLETGYEGTEYVDTEVNLGGYYRYTVKAVNEEATSKYVSTPSVKYNLTPVVKAANSGNGIKVTWTTAVNATGYTVYSSTYNTKTKKWSGWKKRGTAAPNKTAWVDKGVKAGSYYRYTVRALNGSFKSSYASSGNTVCLSVPYVSITKSSNSVNIRWNKIAGAKTYTVYRSHFIDGEWSGWYVVGSTSKSEPRWSDSTALRNITYRYTVRAVNGGSRSSYTASSSVKGVVTDCAHVNVDGECIYCGYQF